LKNKERREKTERINEESKHLFSWEAKAGAGASDSLADSTREASNAACTRLSVPHVTTRSSACGTSHEQPYTSSCMTTISIALRSFCSYGVHHQLLWLSSTPADSERGRTIFVTGQVHDRTKNKCLYIYGW